MAASAAFCCRGAEPRMPAQRPKPQLQGRRQEGTRSPAGPLGHCPGLSWAWPEPAALGTSARRAKAGGGAQQVASTCGPRRGGHSVLKLPWGAARCPWPQAVDPVRGPLAGRRAPSPSRPLCWLWPPKCQSAFPPNKGWNFALSLEVIPPPSPARDRLGASYRCSRDHSNVFSRESVSFVTFFVKSCVFRGDFMTGK